jgi:hypothetical protein
MDRHPIAVSSAKNRATFVICPALSLILTATSPASMMRSPYEDEARRLFLLAACAACGDVFAEESQTLI